MKEKAATPDKSARTKVSEIIGLLDQITQTADKPAQAEVDAILEFLERCATAFNHGNGYTLAPRVGKMTLDVRKLLHEYCAENGPDHVYELARLGVDLVRAASRLIP